MVYSKKKGRGKVKGIIKRGDIFIFGLIVLLSGISALILYSGEEGARVKVTVDNEVLCSYSLSQSGEHPIESEAGINILVIKDGKAFLKDSDCSDKTCERMGKIDAIGEQIVCLPHKLLVEVE